jgi:hypothetical protein
MKSIKPYNFIMFQGSTFTLPLRLTSNDVPIDLTDYTFAGQMRTSVSAAIATENFTFTVQVPATGGIVIVSLTDAETAAIVARQYVYDIEMTDGDGSTTRILQGTITVDPEVTRGV